MHWFSNLQARQHCQACKKPLACKPWWNNYLVCVCVCVHSSVCQMSAFRLKVYKVSVDYFRLECLKAVFWVCFNFQFYMHRTCIEKPLMTNYALSSHLKTDNAATYMLHSDPPNLMYLCTPNYILIRIILNILCLLHPFWCLISLEGIIKSGPQIQKQPKFSR